MENVPRAACLRPGGVGGWGGGEIKPKDGRLGSPVEKYLRPKLKEMNENTHCEINVFNIYKICANMYKRVDTE